jgi:hypothetical protein
MYFIAVGMIKCYIALGKIMDAFKDAVEKAAKKSDRLILNQETLGNFMKLGFPVGQLPVPSMAQYLDELFSKRKENALTLAKQLPDSPSFHVPSIQSLYNEIKQCIIFGLNGAAITLSGILVEFTLKYATYVCEVGNTGIYDSTKWDEFESLTFEPAIVRAAKNNLLTAEMTKKLKDFKNDFRNPYNHFNIKKITRNVIWRDVSLINVKTQTVEKKDICAKDDLVIQAQAKPIVDQHNVFAVFNFSNDVVLHLLGAINKKNG